MAGSVALETDVIVAMAMFTACTLPFSLCISDSHGVAQLTVHVSVLNPSPARVALDPSAERGTQAGMDRRPLCFHLAERVAFGMGGRRCGGGAGLAEVEAIVALAAVYKSKSALE